MRVVVVGCGTVGSRASRQLLTVGGVEEVALVDTDAEAAGRLQAVLGGRSRVAPVDSIEGASVVVLARPPGHLDAARRALRAGAHVVSCSDDLADVEGLLALDHDARRGDRSIVVGAGFMPGLTDVLAVHGARELDVVDEVHVAKLGTAGPACARQHHAALPGEALDWRDGTWVRRPGGSGRELLWFPDPIGGADCYRGALPDALLLHAEFPGADRITARMAATRRDRLTAWLPMMRRPHREAGPGAVRVELRGRRDGIQETVILACMDRASVAAGAVAAVAVDAVLQGRGGALGLTRRGAGGLGSLVASTPFLAELALRGVKCARFEGARDRQ
jgi:saccharopine dehydrogenase-like NADP-dependent oxidoreductase